AVAPAAAEHSRAFSLPDPVVEETRTGSPSSALLRRRMLHVHVHPALFQFLQHPAQTLLLRLRAFRARDPAEIVVLLISGTLTISLHQSAPFQRLAHEGRHRVLRALQAGVVHGTHHAMKNRKG